MDEVLINQLNLEENEDQEEKRRKKFAEVMGDLFVKHENKVKLIFWVKIVAGIITVSNTHLLCGHSRIK